jgi:hypothetical protein
VSEQEQEQEQEQEPGRGRGRGTPNLEVTVAVLRAAIAPDPTRGFMRRPMLLRDTVPSDKGSHIDEEDMICVRMFYTV